MARKVTGEFGGTWHFGRSAQVQVDREGLAAA